MNQGDPGYRYATPRRRRLSHACAPSVIPAKAGISLSSLATQIKALNKVSHILKEIPDIAARFRDDDSFRHPRALSVISAKADISLSSLATQIKVVNKVSRVPKRSRISLRDSGTTAGESCLREIPDTAMRFGRRQFPSSPCPIRHFRESRNLLKQSGYVNRSHE